MKNKIIALLLLINFISCKTDDPHLNQKISAEITQTKHLNLSNEKSFVWDELIILHPYSSTEMTEKKHTISLRNVSKNIEHSDDFNLLVFLKKKKAVKSIELKRNLGDFENIYDTLILQKDANFILVGEIFSDNPALFKLNKK